MPTPVIKLADISVKYRGENVLDHINLEVEAGDYVGVIGPNGGGKTTLVRTMLGLTSPDAGRVELFGSEVQSFHHWAKVGYVPQKSTSFDNRIPITVEEVVSLGLLSSGRRERPGQEAIESALEKVGLADQRRRLLNELSGGQQQRVFIAKALAADPELLVLDEPTVGIDVRSQDEFYQLLSRLNREEGLTLVMVSHDVDVVVNEVTRIACINETLVYHGAPKDFIKGDYLAELYGKSRKFIIHGH